MGGQGRSLSEEKLQKILDMLKSSELNFVEIAERFGVSRSTVTQINLRYKVRNYNGTRSKFVLF